jgi:hypothetical protein
LHPDGCPDGEKLVETSGGVTGESFRSDGDLAAGIAEGTAMLEIIHDLAPGAELWATNGSGGTSLDLKKRVDYLAPNVDVIVSDVAFPAFFPDGQNPISQALTQSLDDPSTRTRAFFQSVGNYADRHYSGDYSDSGIEDDDNIHLFSANSETTGTFDISNVVFGSINDRNIVNTNRISVFKDSGSDERGFFEFDVSSIIEESIVEKAEVILTRSDLWQPPWRLSSHVRYFFL